MNEITFRLTAKEKSNHDFEEVSENKKFILFSSCIRFHFSNKLHAKFLSKTLRLTYIQYIFNKNYIMFKDCTITFLF